MSLVPAVHAAPTNHGLLVGINDYHDVPGVSPLSGPKNDIALVHQLLISRFAMPETNIISLLDSQATHTGIQRAAQGGERG